MHCLSTELSLVENDDDDDDDDEQRRMEHRPTQINVTFRIEYMYLGMKHWYLTAANMWAETAETRCVDRNRVDKREKERKGEKRREMRDGQKGKGSIINIYIQCNLK